MRTQRSNLPTPNRHLLTGLLGLLVLLTGVSAGCGSSVERVDDRPESEKNAEPAPLNDQVFVDAQQALSFRDEGALLIDTRPKADFKAGHIPGAVHAPGGSDFKDDYGFLWKNEAKLQEIARSYGLDRDQKVVVYGNTVDKGAGRLFWTLEYLGHGQVHLLADGHEAIAAEFSGDLEEGASSPETGDFVVATRESVRATADEVEAVATGQRDGVIIDNRRRSEYTGEEVRQNKARGKDPRQGYIPTAIHHNWKKIFDGDGKLLDKETLRQQFQDAGILNKDALSITYCQTGTRTGFVYATLRWLGDENVANYDGSWVEWSRDMERPVAHVDDN